MVLFCHTFGCKVNQYETENIKEEFQKRGYAVSEDFLQADICLVNTCTVTAQSDLKCRQLVRKIKKSNPDCILVLAGCFPQAFSQKAEELTECDIIVGSNNKREIPDLTEEFLKNKQRIIKINTHTKGETIEPMSNSGGDKTRAYIKIQDGCDQRCTYCIIPDARGHICSKPLNDIKSEVSELVKSGHKEIILTGINLCCYGRDFKDGTRLIDAIETACSCKGDYRVRLSSLEPELITENDIKRMALLEKLCPHFHLAMQSGCDNTLNKMGRHYDTKRYKYLCDKFREYFPHCALTTDIMVGFPGETEEDFNNSLLFTEEISFADSHIFPYSRRPGTPADKFSGQLDKKTKHERAAKMSEVCEKGKAAYLKSMIGKTVKVLFEKETSPEWYQGHSPEYVLVKVKRENPDNSLKRCFKNVKITDCDNECCYGMFDVIENNEKC